MARTRMSAAEELAEAHASVMEDLSKLENAVRAASPSITEVRAELGRTQAHITKHFLSEERGGYMDAVRKREPRFERTIQELRDEHARMASDLENLRRHARTASTADKPFCDDVLTWIASLRHHEGRENQLVQEAFGIDVGAED